MRKTKTVLACIMVMISLISCSKTNYPVDLATPFSELQITGVQVTSSYPEGCDISTDDNCFQAESGEKVVMIWIVPKGEYDEGEVRNGIFDNCASATIRSRSGNGIPASMGGRMPDGRFYLQFYVPEDIKKIELTWFKEARLKLPQ
jgi:hypothetical protein